MLRIGYRGQDRDWLDGEYSNPLQKLLGLRLQSHSSAVKWLRSGYILKAEQTGVAVGTECVQRERNKGVKDDSKVCQLSRKTELPSLKLGKAKDKTC